MSDSRETVSQSPSSEWQGTLLEQVLSEREFARERLQEDVIVSEERNELREWTISWEKAIERELEYRRRLKKILQQNLTGPEDLLMPCQEMPPKENTVGLKCETTSWGLSQQASQVYNGQLPQLPRLKEQTSTLQVLREQQPSPQQLQHKQPIPSQPQLRNRQPILSQPQLQDGQPLLPLPQLKGRQQPLLHLPQLKDRQPPPPLLQLQDRQHSPQQSQDRRPLPEQLQYSQPVPQQLQHKEPPQQPSQQLKHPHPSSQMYQRLFSQHSEGRRPLPQPSLNQQTLPKQVVSYWCHICKLDCTNFNNLKSHRRGKQHKAKIGMLHASKKIGRDREMIWCTKCNIPCMNEMTFTQHLVGKKHLARISKQAVEAAGGARTIHNVQNIGGELEAGEGCHDENLGQRWNERSASDQPLQPTAQSQRLRTTNWPNYI